ncbi:MAG: 50S ribosomal protein L2 [Patescibacteria group bacterium]|jgi:large subunit ribosomal protein L2
MLQIYKPTTPGRRKMSIVKSKELTREEPNRQLITIKKSRAGRSHGRIAVRHQGAGEKKFYRHIDFKQDKFNIPGKVARLEYDPNRTCWIALIFYPDGEKRYILAPDKLKVGDTVMSSKEKIEPQTGNRMPLKFIPTGYNICNIELQPGTGGQIVRSAGALATLMTYEGSYVGVKLPSSERRLISENCSATIGQVSNPEWQHTNWGKAGRMRHRGIRPSVRGKAMAPVAHPHGGGEGHSPIGMVAPKTPWGKPALGVKTRNKKKWTNKYIINRRVKKVRKK